MKSHEDEVIVVSSVQEGGVEGHYRTMFLRSGEEGGEFELLFFRRLDNEFNKVLRFYKKKVEEVTVEADELSKQMNALIALRIKVDNPVVGEVDMVHLSDHKLSSNSSSMVHPIHGGQHGRTQMDVIQEVEMDSEGISGEEMKKAERHFRPAPLNVLDHVKINVERETPVSILRSVIKSSKSDLLFDKQELRTAEEKISEAFVEFYRKLRLLKSWVPYLPPFFLNQLAFSKIMKKYDKVTTRNASKTYLQMVDKSYLGTSVEVTKLMEKVEETYVKQIANGNHRKGMKTLRPQAKKERHRITFLNGFFSGCSIALIVAIIVNIHARNILKSQGRERYMVNIFPLYSLFGYVVLHMLMYAGNVYFWKRYRINYSFIFGFKQGTELGYREVLLLSSGLSMLAFAGVISNLDMEMDPRTKSFKTLTELVPLFLLIVPLPDFFLADQLTSQVQAIRSLEFYICYYGWGNFKERLNTCGEMKFMKNSTNPWLRDKLAVPHKGLYYVAMVLNCVLRLAWMQQVLGIQTVPFLHKTALASLEIVRRGIWNFFRLENEHLNNVRKYRAFKSVPLPFHYDYNGNKNM
ncbi:hypothetical protein V6N12_021356 [Hibiscus sabdariffa]|uniref:Uncharacterized protein n=1 Tax=Hibiscus sabdariffa TaxID=183260 RepID=A0ABR2FRL7_9ROSI